MRRTIADNGLFLLRIAVSLLMLSHGVPKALEYQTLIHDFPDPLNVGTEVSLQLVLFAEIGCSALLILGLLGGIGFTMSIFIAELGFRGQPDQLLLAKTGILFASVIAGTAGYLWLRFTSRSA